MVVALLAAAMVVGYFGVRIWDSADVRRWRDIRRAKLWSISELPENVIGRVVGTVRATGKTFTAPISGKPCVYYAVRVIRESRYGVDQLSSEIDLAPFEVEDGTGIAAVDPMFAVTTPLAEVYRNGIVHWRDNAQAAFLAKHGLGDVMGISRFEEEVVEIGAQIAIVGFGRRGKDGSLELSSSPHFPLIFARDHTSLRRELPEARLRE